MKIINKLIFTVILVSLIFAIYSMNKIEVNASDIQEQADGFLQKGKDNYNVDLSNVTSEFKSLGNILSYIGAGIMVAVTSYLGVQYIISPPDKQAALKEKLIGVVVSGIVIFGAYSIWNTVVNIVKDF